jgi:hypothetical protein
MRVDWVAFRSCLEDRLPVNSEINDEEKIDKCVEELTSANQKTLVASVFPSVGFVPNHGPRYPLVLRKKYA